MTKRKSYNPFKMWGSWVGLIFGFLIASTIQVGVKVSPPPLTGGLIGYASGSFNALLYGLSTTQLPNSATNLLILKSFFVLLIVTILGFLIGWGIHSFFRSLKR